MLTRANMPMILNLLLQFPLLLYLRALKDFHLACPLFNNGSVSMAWNNPNKSEAIIFDTCQRLSAATKCPSPVKSRSLCHSWQSSYHQPHQLCLSFIFLSYPCFAAHSFCPNRRHDQICCNELGGLSRRLRQFRSSRQWTKAHRLSSARPKYIYSYCFGSWCRLPLHFCSSSIPTLVTYRTRSP